jgi:predicted nucleotidyltransferase
MNIAPVLHKAPLKSFDEKILNISNCRSNYDQNGQNTCCQKKTEIMTLAQDFEDFVKLLNKHQVDYLIVGGYALAFHGKPRHTGDLDIWINSSESNAEKLVNVIQEFGLASLGLTKSDFMQKGYVTQIGYPPLRIDILNTIDGVKFENAYPNKLLVDVNGIEVRYIGLKEFIENKTASGRSQDIADLKEIKKINKEQ